MNGWNVRAATSGNKGRLALLLGFALCLAAGAVRAEDSASAPALLGVKEIQVQHARIGNEAANDACGLASSDMAAEVLKALRLDQLPVFSVMEAPSKRLGVARIDLVPEIVSMQRQGIDCTSWVAVTAQSRGIVRVPPVEIPRNVVVTYWRGGLMVSSPVISHARAVKDALTKLGTQFSKAYRRDQPPPLPEITP